MKINAWQGVNKITKGGVQQSLQLRTHGFCRVLRRSAAPRGYVLASIRRSRSQRYELYERWLRIGAASTVAEGFDEGIDHAGIEFVAGSSHDFLFGFLR